MDLNSLYLNMREWSCHWTRTVADDNHVDINDVDDDDDENLGHVTMQRQT